METRIRDLEFNQRLLMVRIAEMVSSSFCLKDAILPASTPLMRPMLLARLCFVATLSFATLSLRADPASEAKAILDTSGTKGGFIVELGIGDGKVTAALHANDGTVVHGLDKDEAKITGARDWMLKDGVYGQVSVEKLVGSALPYLDNMVNLVVVNDASGVADDEIQRVLAPNGVVVTKAGEGWKKIVKARPLDMDDWTHYMHGADGNPVAHDKHVGPPESLQWVGSPRWSRHHDRMSSISGMVSSNGRIFYIMDMGSRISIMLPPHWKLIARDAFNGIILWQRDIPDWQDHLWPLKSGPTQLTRRIVAIGDKVYVTLSKEALVTCVDATNGKTIREYPGSKTCEEILVDKTDLMVLANHGKGERDDYKILNGGDQGRVEKEFEWDGKPREIVVFDTETGAKKWSKESVVAPLSICANDKAVVYHDGDVVVSLDRSTGKELWRTEKASRRQRITFNFGPRIVLYNDVVLYAGGDGKMRSFDSTTGKLLWEGDHPPSGYQSPQDVIVAKGLVWCAPTTSGNLSGEFTGRDPRTGETKVSFPPSVDTYWFHHRCYMSKATDDFIMPSRTGVEFVNLNTQKWDINHWVRGACLYGVMPANGLVYAPPHDCACYPETKIYGLNAMAPATAIRIKPNLKDSDEGRLERGPAYADTFAESKATTKADWPMYRGNPGRTAFLRSDVGANLSQTWNTKLGGKLSAISVGEGKVFVAQIEQHTLHALDQKSGTPVWHFTTGGRIDSPPSIWKGRVLFGSSDGWVYCLRAKDGAMVWRFRGAPRPERHMAFEGLESVWPVSGAVLVEDGVASFVAGRSNFLDGGLRFVRLDAAEGSKLVETSVDDKNPNTGADFQDSLQTLQMPAGLADILVSDGKFTYMKSQKFAADGSRPEFGVNSGNAIAHGADQQGDGAHVYAPMGFLDDSWFHRSYWVYGKNMAGGHNGYYQAGKFTPAGRILCVDDQNVYSYARKPQYYKWTTPLEHHLFSAPKEAPKVKESLLAKALEGGNPRKQQKKADKGGKGQKGKAPAKTDDAAVKVAKSDSLDPSNKAFTVEAWIRAEQTSGVIVVQGAGMNGYGLALRNGKPAFATISDKVSTLVEAPVGIDDSWHHLAGVMQEDKTMKLYVDGQMAAESKAKAFIAKNPNLGLSVGDDNANGVFNNTLPSFTGWIDLIRVSLTGLRPEDAKSLASNPDDVTPPAAKTVLALTFDQKNTKDSSPANNHGKGEGLIYEKGASGGVAIHLASDAPKQGPGAVAANKAPADILPKDGYFVEPHWTKDVPIIARGMAMANTIVFVAGPADVVDEEDALVRLSKGDDSIVPALKEQDENLDGKHGATILAIDAPGGNVITTTKLSSPPVWDGMAAAQGCIFVSQLDGSIVCLKGS